MARGTTLRNVRIDDERWDALGETAATEGRDRSAVIRGLIDEYLNVERVSEYADRPE